MKWRLSSLIELIDGENTGYRVLNLLR
eukprot:SAG11_NODE_24261_length_376_cov_0.357401_1_plen_26_part_01